MYLWICQKRLFDKLQCCDNKVLVLDWIKSYILGRTQAVRISNIIYSGWIQSYTSSFQICAYNVPQGSYLGHHYFLFMSRTFQIVYWKVVLFFMCMIRLWVFQLKMKLSFPKKQIYNFIIWQSTFLFWNLF